MNEESIKEAFEDVKVDITALDKEIAELYSKNSAIINLNEELYKAVRKLQSEIKEIKGNEKEPFHNNELYKYLKRNQGTAFKAREIAKKFNKSYPKTYGRLNYLVQRGYISKEKTGYNSWFVYKGDEK